MHTRAAQVLLLVLSLILAIFILIAATKYAAWAHAMTTATGGSLTLILYIGTIPLFSLLYTTAHLAALQLNRLPIPQYPGSRKSIQSAAYDPEYTVSSTFVVLVVSIVHFMMWLLQSILCTSCELAPILAGTEGRVPRWCPQSRFKDSGQPSLANMLATLATVKDFTQWTMVLTTIFLVECARREHMHAEQIRTQLTQRGDTGVDFVVSQRPDIGLAAGALSKISGPRLVTMEDGAMQQRLQGNGDVKHEQDRRQMVHAPPQPMAPDASGTTDNHYGNRMTLKRSGNLNHMYESRT